MSENIRSNTKTIIKRLAIKHLHIKSFTPFPVSHRGEKLSPLLLLPDLLPLWGKAGKGVNITEGMEINFKLF